MLTHHFIFKGAFKFKPSVTGSPVVYHYNHITQRGQGIQAEILDSFKPIIHQLHLRKKIHLQWNLLYGHIQKHKKERMLQKGESLDFLYYAFKMKFYFLVAKTLKWNVPLKKF